MYDITTHDIYSLNCIVAFVDPEVGIQAQGRVMSMYSENEDLSNMHLVVKCLRRPFGEDANILSDSVGPKHKIYEYWDSTECVTISEHWVLDVIGSVTCNKNDVDYQEFFDEYSESELKRGCIIITGFQDNDGGVLYDFVEPKYNLWHYHLDWENLDWDYENFPRKTKRKAVSDEDLPEDFSKLPEKKQQVVLDPDDLPLNMAFLGLVKEEIFDPFISPHSKNAGNNHSLFRYLLVNASESSVTTIVGELLKPGNELLKQNQMRYPKICLPVITRVLSEFAKCSDKSVARLLQKMDTWGETEIKPCLKMISGFSHKEEDTDGNVKNSSSSLKKKIATAGEISDDEEEEERGKEVVEVEEDDEGDLGSFIEDDLIHDDESVTKEDLKKKSLLFEGESLSGEEEEEEGESLLSTEDEESSIDDESDHSQEEEEKENKSSIKTRKRSRTIMTEDDEDSGFDHGSNCC
jgi:hypothetical protein